LPQGFNLWACARFTKCPCGRRHAPAAPERLEISVDALPANCLGGLFPDDSAHDQVQDLAHQVLVIEQAGNVLLQVETKVLMGRLIHRCAPTRPGRE
ncbi:hypothetical protein ACQLQW_006586, partial [Pseudomonas aeruginosa]